MNAKERMAADDRFRAIGSLVPVGFIRWQVLQAISQLEEAVGDLAEYQLPASRKPWRQALAALRGAETSLQKLTDHMATPAPWAPSRPAPPRRRQRTRPTSVGVHMDRGQGPRV